jgi:hypothetical protein
MFVQYSFVEKHQYPGFKPEPIRFGQVPMVTLGIAAMLLTTLGYVIAAS